MERRGQENNIGMGNNNNPINFTPPQITQESTVKLPLAPLLSTPPDHRRPNASMVSTRRGSSIFSPVQTLNPPHFHPPPPPLSPQNDGADATDPDPVPPPPTTYKECQKNHAASMGAHVVDGCGEFMPGGDDGTPESMKCAACDCHRKETDGDQQQHQHHHRSSCCSAAAESSSEDLNASAGQPSSGSRKRFRTKFSEDQKRRMHDFATKIGWRIQKQDEQQGMYY